MRQKAAVAVLWILCVAASWASHVYASGDTAPASFGTVITTLVGIGGTYLLMRRKNNADADLAGASALQISGETIESLFVQVRTLQALLTDAEARARALDEEVCGLREEVALLRAALRPGRKTDMVPPHIQTRNRRR